MDMDLLDLYDRGYRVDEVEDLGRQGQAGRPHALRAVEGARRDEPHARLASVTSRSPRRARTRTLPRGDTPPDKLAKDPVQQYDRARKATLETYRAEGVLEKTGPALGIAFVDQLVHGWDIAKATGQDTTMPDDLAQAAFQMVDGRMPDDQRGDAFKPAVEVPDERSPRRRSCSRTWDGSRRSRTIPRTRPASGRGVRASRAARPDGCVRARPRAAARSLRRDRPAARRRTGSRSRRRAGASARRRDARGATPR